MANGSLQRELEDLHLKLRSARAAAAAATATEKDKADLKLIEQDHVAAQQRARRHADAGEPPAQRVESKDSKKVLDARLDEALKGTFPGSDPVSFVEAAPVKAQDRSLLAVRVAEQQQPEKTARRKDRNDPGGRRGPGRVVP